METMNLVYYINATHDEDEIALVNKDTGEVYVSGDYYHTKASVKAEGFLLALDALGVSYTKEEIEIYGDHEMFNKLYFQDES